jgi:hypothetical protein
MVLCFRYIRHSGILRKSLSHILECGLLFSILLVPLTITAMHLFDRATFLETLQMLLEVSKGAKNLKEESFTGGLFWFVYIVIAKVVVASLIPAVISE